MRYNSEDINRGFAQLDFAPGAQQIVDEGVAENARRLFALCKARQINRLICIGFAINRRMPLNPCGMAEMTKHGILCSRIRQAVTAVENKESARLELHKGDALWRVAMAFGYVLILMTGSKPFAASQTRHNDLSCQS